MSANPQSQAIQIANQLMAISAQMISLWQQMVSLDAAWTDQGAAAALAAMGTVALNPDGTMGAADGAPNAAHPLDPVKYPALSHSISSNQIGQIKTVLDNGIVNYVNGVAVATTPGARAILNVAVGG